MDSLQSFGDALTELERILTAMAEMAARTDPAWKREFIEMRRRLQMQITAVATAADQCAEIKRKPEASARLREGWTNMRSGLALHQANWPAVAIDKEHPDYIASVRKTRTTNWAFVDLAREIIAEARVHRGVNTRAGGYIDPASIGL